MNAHSQHSFNTYVECTDVSRADTLCTDMLSADPLNACGYPLGSCSLEPFIKRLKSLCRLSADTSVDTVALACEPSLEGVVSAIGLTYLAHVRPSKVCLVRNGRYQGRFGEYVMQGPDPAEESTVALAQRVLAGFEKRQGREAVRRIVLACASDDPNMPDVVYHFMREGFSKSVDLIGDLVCDATCRLNALARQVNTECEHMRQFVRFSRMSDNSFMAVFRPNANVLPLATGYFVRRLNNERFFIVDPVHRIVTFYAPELTHFGIMKPDKVGIDGLISRKDLAADELYVKALWKRFYEGIGLPDRDASQRGYDLRAHWMPKRFWSGLTELATQDLPSNAKVPKRYQGARR